MSSAAKDRKPLARKTPTVPSEIPLEPEAPAELVRQGEYLVYELVHIARWLRKAIKQHNELDKATWRAMPDAYMGSLDEFGLTERQHDHAIEHLRRSAQVEHTHDLLHAMQMWLKDATGEVAGRVPDYGHFTSLHYDIMDRYRKAQMGADEPPEPSKPRPNLMERLAGIEAALGIELDA